MSGTKNLRLSLCELEELPTIGVSSVGFLKIEEHSNGTAMRVWLGFVRFTILPYYFRSVIVEESNTDTGKWEVVDSYEVT